MVGIQLWFKRAIFPEATGKRLAVGDGGAIKALAFQALSFNGCARRGFSSPRTNEMAAS
jgi:hypothetical protein